MSSEGAGNNVRAEATRHIQEHSLGEAARIGRLSRIREFVLGAQDGLLVPLGVVTGMAAAHPARTLIIVAGLAEAFAGAISMGGGSFRATLSTREGPARLRSRCPEACGRLRAPRHGRPG